MENDLTIRQISDVLFSNPKNFKANRKGWNTCNSTWNTLHELILSRRFSDMKKRCYNPNSKHYHNYGGRGIYICDEWLNDKRKFVEWSLKNGFKPELSLDRIDVNGPYAPWNCRWVNNKIQSNNKTCNTFITVDGVTKTLAGWTEFLGCKSRVVIYHLYWSDPSDAEWFVKYMLSKRR